MHIELLNELLTELKGTQSLVPGLLFNGISREQIDEVIEGLNIKLPEEVYTLYEWKNGTALSSSLIPAESWLFPGGIFCSLEDVVSSYKHLAGNDECWPPNLFMLFEEDGGVRFLIDCDEESPSYRKIYKYSLFDVDYDVTITFYDSLEALIKTIIECFKEKAYFYDSDSPYKVIQVDSSKKVHISRKHNPNSDYWKILE